MLGFIKEAEWSPIRSAKLFFRYYIFDYFFFWENNKNPNIKGLKYEYFCLYLIIYTELFFD